MAAWGDLFCDKYKCAKALGWRCLASLDTFVIVYLVNGSAKSASKVTVIEIITKFILYYLYEHLTECIYIRVCGGGAVVQDEEERDRDISDSSIETVQ